MIEQATKKKGADFLLEASDPSSTFTPEDHTEEQKMLRKAIRDFIDQEIEPNKEIFDTVEGTSLAPEKLEKLGALGFLGLSVPETFGGFGCDIKSDLVASEVMSDSYSFSQSLGVQRGLGINTILFYGNEEQRQKYLSGIIAGQIKCSYCLTEPGAGSDANSGKTKATISEDGKHYIINGQKMWITNAGFADVFSVFCKIEDDPNLSCLIVEKDWGVKLGAEEKKLGIHGSSTRQVFFENVKVPVENLLGERNKGFKIAMNALNMGRLMIGIAGSSIAKRAFHLGLHYANERIQFGKPISSFGAIQEKIAKMGMEIFALESAWHRLGGDMDNVLNASIASGINELKAKQKVSEEFAVECALIKVLGSEIEQYVVDEALQMHGGMGFSGESDISMHYRNVRGNRIYEGTNEINRLVIAGTVLKKGMTGQLPLMENIMSVFSALKAETIEMVTSIEGMSEMQAYLSNIKKASLLTIGMAAKKYQADIKNQQQVLSRLSDLISYIYFIESSILRSTKSNSEIQSDLTRLYIAEKIPICRQAVKEVVSICAREGKMSKDVEGILNIIRFPDLDIISLRKKVSSYFINKNAYNI